MIDLHTHILPGIDDGARYLEDSLEMADIAAGCGVKYICATPHANQMGRFENFFDSYLISLFQDLQEQIARERIPVDLLLGMEIFASEDMDLKIHQKKLIGLNGSNYYLVEWQFDEHPENIRRFLLKIIKNGGIPLIAHPERYYCVQEYPVLAYEWLQMGCYTQINKGSLFGKFGREEEKTAKLLLENDLVTCMGTDAHRPYMRTTFMADGRDYLLDQFGTGFTRRLTHDNPMAILTNRKIAPHGKAPERIIY